MKTHPCQGGTNFGLPSGKIRNFPTHRFFTDVRLYPTKAACGDLIGGREHAEVQKYLAENGSLHQRQFTDHHHDALLPQCDDAMRRMDATCCGRESSLKILVKQGTSGVPAFPLAVLSILFFFLRSTGRRSPSAGHACLLPHGGLGAARRRVYRSRFPPELQRTAGTISALRESLHRSFC
jgi:hypothetical protein